jgi:tellurite resistance protein
MVRRVRRSSYATEEATSGLNDRTTGLLWLAGGAAVTFITYIAAGPGGTYLVTWGAMLYGAVKLLGSLGDVHDEDGAPLAYRDRIALGQEMALRAMFFMAREAGGVTDARAAAIDAILWRITDSQFPDERRAALLAESEAAHETLLAMLRAERDRIAPTFVDIILNSAAQVARADGPVGADAELKLKAIAGALGLDDAAVRAAIAAAEPR